MTTGPRGSNKKSRSRKEAGAPREVRPQATAPGAAPRTGRWTGWVAASIAAVAFIAAALGYVLWNGSAPSASTAAATFVGTETCTGCHRPEADLWRTSQHKLAMDHASEKSVLGDFNDARFDYYGVSSRFFRKDGKFLVETDGPDGKLAAFEIKYTFGVDPLQQYLIEFPDGRLQALSIAWDSRAKAQGGQRWFHLYPNEEIKHDDVLHWTKLNQNWNFMCAGCHSTGVAKNYDAANDRFATTWAEISVGCEGCHGQGSNHVRWARARAGWWPLGKQEDPTKGLIARFDERSNVVWHGDQRGNPQRSFAPALVRKEVETCGLCHARRGEFSESWLPGRSLSDTHVVTPLARGLYEADGQMRDVEETYNYGPFKQSKMFAAGVTCSDCHDPHAARLRAPGDGVCLQCHAGDKYAAATHSHHETVNPPLACASCHMPVRSYMGVDLRHDHSFRIPRPDLSAKLGTPNACNDCHTDKPAEWAAGAIDRWYGPERHGFQTYAGAFHAAWSDQPDAAAQLAAVVSSGAPAYARASALSALAPHPTQANVGLARASLSDPDPMVRIAALDVLETMPPAQAWPLAAPLLSDSVRGVRLRAVSLLAATPTANQPAADRERFERAAAEFIAAQRLNADRPEARTTLGSFYARRGLTAEAESEYKAAQRLSPQFAPAAINLADLYRKLGRDGDGEVTLRAALAVSPRDAGLHHALGLVLIRLKRHEDALGELAKAAELDPDRARYAYVYAVALNSVGRRDDAIATLKTAVVRHPADRDILLALVTFNRDAGDIPAAVSYGNELTRIAPDDRELANFVDGLRRQMK